MTTLKKLTASATTATLLVTSVTGCGIPGAKPQQQDSGFGKIDVSQYVSEADMPKDEAKANEAEETVETAPAEEEESQIIEVSDAAQLLTKAFPNDLKMAADLNGGSLEIQVSGDNECMTLTKPDGKFSSFYLLDGNMYIYQNIEDSAGNYKITEADFDASPNTSTSDSDFIKNLAIGKDISQYTNAKETGEDNIDGINYRVISVPDSDSNGKDVVYYLNMGTDKCDYIEMPSAADDGTYTRFRISEGEPLTEQPWMAECKDTDADTFSMAMVGFIFMAFAGDPTGTNGPVSLVPPE